MDKSIATKVLVSILLSWEDEHPKAVSVEALQRVAGVSGPAFVGTVNALATARRVVAKVSGGTFVSITPSGADWLYSECLGLPGWKDLPALSAAVREELARLIADYYKGTEIGAFLKRIGLVEAGWQGGATKWRELLAIVERWRGTPHVLVYYVIVAFVSRSNLVKLDDDERARVLRSVNKILSAQDVAVGPDNRVVRVGQEHARNRGVSLEALAAVKAYRWHPNELNGLAEALSEYSGCRTRKEGQSWLQKATKSAPAPLRGASEALLDYWRRSLEAVLEKHASAGLLAVVSLLADPREHLGRGDVRPVHEAVNHALEWSPLRMSGEGQLVPRGSDASERPAAESLTQVRGVRVAEGTVRKFLEHASEDDATTALIAPLLRMSGFVDVAVKGHRDKSGEFGQDIRQLKLPLPTGHALFFAVQVKAGDINADARGQGSNIETVLTQARMALGKKSFDSATQAHVAINHVLLVATGHITESARTYLHEQLADGNRSVLLIDRDRLVDMATLVGLPEEYAASVTGGA